MKVLIADYNSYVGKKITSFLHSKEYEVIALTSGKTNSSCIYNNHKVFNYGTVKNTENLTADIAFYTPEDCHKTKKASSSIDFKSFFSLSKRLNVKHLICLTTILNNDEQDLKNYISENKNNSTAITFIKADFIIGSGSPAFEIIRNVTEKLPVIIAPRWTKTPYNPIAIDDLLDKLFTIINNQHFFNKTLKIGNNENINLRKMSVKYAKARGTLRLLISTPFSLPRLSVFLLRILTKYPEQLLFNFVCNLNNKHKNLEFDTSPKIETNLSYSESLKLSLGFTSALRIKKNKEEYFSGSVTSYAYEGYNGTPTYGCSSIKLESHVDKRQVGKIAKKINSIGKNKKWFYINWLWHFTGWATWLTETKKEKSYLNGISKGKMLDFWIVQIADDKNIHYLFFADLFLPGEGWLEFKVIPGNDCYIYRQTLIFRPLGFTGRFYWLWAKPLNWFVMKKIKKEFLRNN